MEKGAIVYNLKHVGNNITLNKSMVNFDHKRKKQCDADGGECL